MGDESRRQRAHGVVTYSACGHAFTTGDSADKLSVLSQTTQLHFLQLLIKLRINSS